MDSNNWRPTQADQTPQLDGNGDWSTQLQPDSRQRIVNKIMETLKRHLPYSGQEGLEEIKKIAIRFEEKVYSEATSQSDYLRKISLKMLTMESKYQNTLTNALPSNSSGAGFSRNPQDSAWKMLHNLEAAEGRMGAPPTSKEAVQGLRKLEVRSKEESYMCAICKDGVSVGEVAKEMPCGHGYHGDCIVSWLAARNSCPVCRYELPTDDPEYEEKRKKGSGAGAGSSNGGGNSSFVMP